MVFCVWIQITTWGHLHSSWGTFFSISCKAGLITTHCLDFWLFGNAFISPLFFKINFAGCRILCWWFFSFRSPLPHSKLQRSLLAMCLMMIMMMMMMMMMMIICSNWLDHFSKVYSSLLHEDSHVGLQGVPPRVWPKSLWDDSSFHKTLIDYLFPLPHPTAKLH